MIGKSALDNYRMFKDPYQTEKDYLQDILLYGIYRDAAAGLVFKGGTAFSKFYSSDRFSEDLDFTLTSHNEGSVEYAKKLIKNSVSLLEYKNEYVEEPKPNEYKTVTAEILIYGPRYNGRKSTEQHISFEISTGKSLLMEPIAIPRNPIYPDAVNYVALVMQKDEIIAEKFRALMSPKRKHRERDLYDIYYFIGKGVKPNIKNINKKLKEVGSTQASLELFDESLKQIEPHWNDLEPLVQHKLEDFGNISNIVKDAFKQSLQAPQ